MSPYLQGLAVHAGQDEQYEHAEKNLQHYLRVEVPKSQIFRLTTKYGELSADLCTFDEGETVKLKEGERVYGFMDGSMVLNR